MKAIGEMLVDTHQQRFSSQEVALRAYGINHLFQEYESGRKN